MAVTDGGVGGRDGNCGRDEDGVAGPRIHRPIFHPGLEKWATVCRGHVRVWLGLWSGALPARSRDPLNRFGSDWEQGKSLTLCGR